ncbi:MAG: sugar phosphate isomerase/epimerase family protein [Opitutus sp.]
MMSVFRVFRRSLPGGLVGALLFALASVDASAWPFFALDNGVGRGEWTPERQATTLHELGYDGISYNYTNAQDLKVWLAQLKQNELRLHALYFGVKLEGEPTMPDGLEEAIELLRSSPSTVLWMIMPAASVTADSEERALQRVRMVADFAAKAGVRLVLYPHLGCMPATAEQAMALVTKSERANVGITVNLAHELAAGNGARLPEIIRRVAPMLQMVSINGATDQPGALWKNFIQPLGRGDYNVAVLLETLREVNYTGSIGLQSYAIRGEPRSNLKESMQAWKTLNEKKAP